MKKLSLSSIAKNIKSNIGLLFSTFVMLCLFLSPTLISLILIVAIFLTILIVVAFDIEIPPVICEKKAKTYSVLLTLLTLCIGFYAFRTRWSPSGKVAELAESVGMSASTFLLIVSSVGCFLGAYAMYMLFYRIVLWSVILFKNHFPVQNKSEIKSNLKKNCFFVISAMAFFLLNSNLTLGCVIGLGIAFMIVILFTSQTPSLRSYTKIQNKVLRILSVITAIGICLACQESFCLYWSVISKNQTLGATLPIEVDIIAVVSIIGVVGAMYFVYFWVLVIWSSITEPLKEAVNFGKTKIPESVAYILFLIVALGFMVFSFSQTQAFYGTEFYYDIIYTSDSPCIVKENVYLDLMDFENDLRQPLFAVFAAPFTGIPYLMAKLIGATASVQAMLINSVQIIMLFAANLILAGMLKLNPLKRFCFMLLTCCTYTQLLFTLMMEQYIIAYFWLILCIYLISEKQKPDRIALWGAGGTLLTGMILLPFMSDNSPIRNFKAWFMDMVKYGLEFAVLMLAFCRFDLVLSLTPQLSRFIKFTGKSVTFADKFCQYTNFIKGCFIAPDAEANNITFDYISWQMSTVTGIDFAGVLILILVVFSAIWNRDKKSSRLAAGWVGFSLVVLLGLGWGTKENGLILYSLYFGWAFLVLLFQLVEKIESKLNIRFLIPVFSACAVITLLVINIPAITEMIDFAITYYPL